MLYKQTGYSKINIPIVLAIISHFDEIFTKGGRKRYFMW